MMRSPTMLDAFADDTEEMQSWVRSSVLSADDVAACVVAGIALETFLMLPHVQVAEYFRQKANDYDRWLAGMRKLRTSMT